MSRSRYKFADNDHPYFMTCTIVGWLPVFTRPETRDIILNSWRFLMENNRMTVFGYVILENHLHFLASSQAISKEVGDFKSFTARKIIDFLQDRNASTLLDQLRYFKERFKSDREFQLWQEGSHPEQILNDAMMRQKLDYAHLNPVKRGYVDKATDWRYSSARNYEGLEGLLPVVTDWLF